MANGWLVATCAAGRAPASSEDQVNVARNIARIAIYLISGSINGLDVWYQWKYSALVFHLIVSEIADRLCRISST